MKIEKFQLFIPQNFNLRAARAACIVALGGIVLSGCFSIIPTVGPSRSRIANAHYYANASAIQFINVDDAVTTKLASQRQLHLFSESIESPRPGSRLVGPGDLLEVTIWEAAPATLFGAPVPGATGIATSRPTALPDQPIDSANTDGAE